MTDIVERLRDPSKGSPRWHDTMLEAANEIERLRNAEAAARREGIEAAAKVCDERGNAEMQTLSDGKEYYRPHADRREAKRCAAAIRALLEAGR